MQPQVSDADNVDANGLVNGFGAMQKLPHDCYGLLGCIGAVPLP